MADSQDVFSDLIAEGKDLDRLVAGLDEAGWATPTPAEGWTVAHQIAHLTTIFKMAALSATDAQAFVDYVTPLAGDFNGSVNKILVPYLELGNEKLLTAWREEREAAEQALVKVPAGQVVPWLVRPLPAPVLAAAGLMELFGHGQDVADALGVKREYTDRVGHLAWFAVRTWDFGYQARGEATPEVEFRFELTGPSGVEWNFGPEDAAQRITGSAADFCLLVTRRRHRADLDVTAVGPDADHWLDIAQAYRGPAGPGRRPGQFAHLH
ncbi:TIGR03084 family metal-binding protein [Kitasatospora sp. NPDC049285]|uniref:TIGR03084 family metal-binding protein n=1 Tax=Kitasatospora sp. NPDC049285 TaxID=3157096 RepID=UPI003420D1A4